MKYGCILPLDGAAITLSVERTLTPNKYILIAFLLLLLQPSIHFSISGQTSWQKDKILYFKFKKDFILNQLNQSIK